MKKDKPLALAKQLSGEYEELQRDLREFFSPYLEEWLQIQVALGVVNDYPFMDDFYFKFWSENPAGFTFKVETNADEPEPEKIFTTIPHEFFNNPKLYRESAYELMTRRELDKAKAVQERISKEVDDLWEKVENPSSKKWSNRVHT